MAAIVLAGGQSRRMGRDKALLDWGGIPMVRHVADLVAGTTNRVIVVADSADRFRLGDLGAEVQVAFDRYPGTGPLGALITGLTLAGPGLHIALACDMPLVRPALLRLLLERARGFDAALPDTYGRLQPLCAAYDAGCIERLVSQLGAARLALHEAVLALDYARIDESELRDADPELISFTNINTPEQYERLQSSR